MSSSVSLTASGGALGPPPTSGKGPPRSYGEDPGEGGPSPQSLELVVRGFAQAVERADATFQVHQSEWWGSDRSGSTSGETGPPDAVHELSPWLGVTRATFTFWAEPVVSGSRASEEVPWWQRAWLGVRRLWQRIRWSLRLLIGKPLPPSYWSTFVGPVGGQRTGAVQITLTIERRDDGRFVTAMEPKLPPRRLMRIRPADADPPCCLRFTTSRPPALHPV